MSQPKITILMLGGARRVSMAQHLKQSGNKLGLDIEILSYELESTVPISIEGKVIIGKRWADNSVVSHIVDLTHQYGINIILPFVDGAIEIASQCRDLLPNVFIPVGDISTSRSMFDKSIAAEIFEKSGIQIPKTYTTDNISYPAIAKPRNGSASKGIKIIANEEDLSKIENTSDYLIQEYIHDNEEYTVDCYVTATGDILCAVPRKRIEVSGGEVVRSRTCRIAIVEDMSREIIDCLKLRGAVTLQFLHDLTTNRYLLMEINPRLGGGVICSICAGAPIDEYIIKEYLGQQLEPTNDWTDNTLMVRYNKEVIFNEK